MADTDADSSDSALFIDDVAAYMAGRDLDATLRALQESHSRLVRTESALLQRRLRLQTKLPEIRKALDAVTLLLAKRGAGEATRVDFQLTDTVFATGCVQGASTVALWLGANVMLEYPLEEARDLLARNADNAQAALESVRADALALRDKITITEVSLARVYNFGVATKQGTQQRQEET